MGHPVGIRRANPRSMDADSLNCYRFGSTIVYKPHSGQRPVSLPVRS